MMVPAIIFLKFLCGAPWGSLDSILSFVSQLAISGANGACRAVVLSAHRFRVHRSCGKGGETMLQDNSVACAAGLVFMAALEMRLHMRGCL